MSAILALDYTTITCYSCAVQFAIPNELYRRRINDHASFWCPNGHQQHFTGPDEASQLRKELERVKNDRDWQRSQRETADRRLVAQRAQTSRYRNKLKRVHNGVCPDCHRTFQNLARHMETKHGHN